MRDTNNNGEEGRGASTEIEPRSNTYYAIAAGTVGNTLEWYDFALYGFMASILSGLFFPSEDRLVSLIATYGVFAVGFILRPLGSVLFGWLGDTIGRSRTLVLSVAMWRTLAGQNRRMRCDQSVSARRASENPDMARREPPPARCHVEKWSSCGRAGSDPRPSALTGVIQSGRGWGAWMVRKSVPVPKWSGPASD